MIHVREKEHVAYLAIGLQSRNILQRIHQMHIVVGGAVHEQKLAIHAPYMIHGSALVVAILIFTRGEHVTLGIYRVVVTPVGYRRHSDSGLIGAVECRRGHERFISTITPSIYSYARTVDIGKISGITSCVDLVDSFVMSEIFVNHIAECRAAETGATRIDTDYRHLLRTSCEPGPLYCDIITGYLRDGVKSTGFKIIPFNVLPSEVIVKNSRCGNAG